jgi:Repeat of unknown function (DUF346)
MAGPRRRLGLAGAILAPVLACLAQLPLPAQATSGLSAPMNMSAWREVANGSLHIFGEVSNTGPDARFVRVACTLYADAGQTHPLATDAQSTELDIIKQNERSPFDVVFQSPPASYDHFGCQLAGGTVTSSVADHDFTTTITSTTATQSVVTGRVENNKDVPVANARVIFTFYKAGNVVDVDGLTANNGEALPPGLPATSFELDRTSDRPAWDGVTAITEAPFPAVQLPPSLAFADQIEGTPSPVNNLVLTNIGTGSLHVAAHGVGVSGTNPTDFAVAQDGCSGHTVAPNATCVIGLTFTPGGLGARSATLSVGDDAAANPQTVTLSGNGLSRAAATISPSSLAYGDQVIHTPATKSVTVTSVGPDPVTINPVVVAGTNAADFSLASDTCSGQTIAVNSTCTISITFTPGALGSRTASLTIRDDGRIAHDPIALTGNGVPSPTAAQAVFDAGQIAFGAQLVETATSHDIHLSNPGTADLSITSIDVRNTSSAGGNDFTGSSSTCPLYPHTLAAGASCTITVTFAPNGIGSRTGTLTVTASNAQSTPSSVALTGTGLADRGPTISSWGRGRLDVFMKGADGALWHKYYASSVGWQGWSSLGAPPGPVTLASDPVAISWGYARIDIFVRGSDNALWHKYYDVNLGGWSIWYTHGGTLTSAPTATSWGSGRLDVFYRGSDNTLRHIFYASFIGVWSAEYNHGGSLASDPSAITWGYGRIDVVARGNDGTLQHDDYDLSAGGWLPVWESEGGSLFSRPTITTWGPGRLDVFAVGNDNSLQHTYFYAGQWQGWTSQGTMNGNLMTSNPGAIAWSAGRLDIFVRGQNATLLHKFYDSSVGWSGWFSDSLLPNPG